MKKLPALFATFAIVLCCASPLKASTQPPPIDTAALQAYAHGTSVLSGSVGFEGGVTAFCAPNIPYVAWYLDQEKIFGRHSAYDRRMLPYTKSSPITKFRTFSCTGLSSGSYLVWVTRLSPGFQGVSDTRAMEDPISGQVTPDFRTINYTDRNGTGSPLLFGPEAVTVAAGTTNVSL